MSFNSVIKLTLKLTLIFGIFTNNCFAVGFGKLQMYSYLNENLSAEIALIGVENLNSELITANLASPKDFIRAGISRPFFLTKLSFEIIRYEDQTVLYISSTKPVKQPFLDFLVELSWPDGRLVKGYTILIDPRPRGLKLVDRPKTLKTKKALTTSDTKFDIPQDEQNNSNPLQQPAPPAVQPNGSVNSLSNITTNNTAKSDLLEQTKLATEPSNNNIAALKQLASNKLQEQQKLQQHQQIQQMLNKQREEQRLQNIAVQTKSNNFSYNDNADLEQAFNESDNLEVANSSGMLGGIINKLKAKPIFETQDLDLKKLAAPNNLSNKNNNKVASLEDLLQDKDQPTIVKEAITLHSKAYSNNTTKKNLNTLADLGSDLNGKSENITSNGIAANNSVANTAKETDPTSNTATQTQTLAKKYGKELVVAFLLVLSSGIFITSILRRAKQQANNASSLANIATENYNPNNASNYKLDNDYIATNSQIADPAKSKTNNHKFPIPEFDNIAFSSRSVAYTNIPVKTPADPDFEDLDLEMYEDFDTNLSDLSANELALPDEIPAIKLQAEAEPILDPKSNLADADQILGMQQYLNENQVTNFKHAPDFAVENQVANNLGTKTGNVLDPDQEVALKINLAKQYFDTGDAVSAKNLLDEIIFIADPKQKREITAILKDLEASTVATA